MRPRIVGVLAAAVLGLAATAYAEGPSVHPYLQINGKTANAGAVKVRQSASQITASFAAPRQGTYRFGVSLCAPAITPLVPGQKSYTASSLTQPLVLHYPYDWTFHVQGKSNILSVRPRLVMPGVIADQRLYVADTHELFSITLKPEHGQVCALLLAHRFFNDGKGDRATADLPLTIGEQRQLVVQIYPDIKAANQARLGTHPSMQGWSTQPPFREWAERSFTPAEYTETARKLQGVFQYVIIREVKSENWIPPLFHQRGMKAIHYQYMGALRRFTPQVTPEVEKQMAMRDAQGRMMTAPIPLKGNWMLADIRQPEVRAHFVENARKAIAAGFDGVFLDGYPVWPDASGDVGGSAPEATESWTRARWQLLHEIKQAIHAQNPQATLGVLANQYFDTLGEADWFSKERMYMAWEREDTHESRATRIQKDMDVATEEQEEPYVPGPLMYGVKGYSPIAVQSALHFIRRPTGLYYTDDGDFPAAQLDDWLDTVRATISQTDLYITDIKPANCAVHFEGRDTARTTEACTVKFSRPLCVTPHSGGPGKSGVSELVMQAGMRYDLTRSCAAAGQPSAGLRKLRASPASRRSAAAAQAAESPAAWFPAAGVGLAADEMRGR